MPPLYLDYLREFGRDSGGFTLDQFTQCGIDDLLQYHSEPDPLHHYSPKDCFPFALDCGRGGRCFVLPQRSGENYRVADYFENAVVRSISDSYETFLFGEIYLACDSSKGSRPTYWLRSRRPLPMDAIVAAVCAAGFVPQWFGDPYRAFLERGNDRVFIFQYSGETVVSILQRNGHDPQFVMRLRYAFPLVPEHVV